MLQSMSSVPTGLSVLPDELILSICSSGGRSLLVNCVQLSKRYCNLLQPAIDKLLQDFVPRRVKFQFPQLDSSEIDDFEYWWAIHFAVCGQDQICVSTRNLRGLYLQTQYFCDGRLELPLDKQGFVLKEGTPYEYFYDAHAYTEEVMDLEAQETIMRRAIPTLTGYLDISCNSDKIAHQCHSIMSFTIAGAVRRCLDKYSFKTSADASLDVIAKQVRYVVHLGALESHWGIDGQHHRRKSMQQAETEMEIHLDTAKYATERDILRVQSLYLQGRSGWSRRTMAKVFYHDIHLDANFEIHDSDSESVEISVNDSDSESIESS